VAHLKPAPPVSLTETPFLYFDDAQDTLVVEYNQCTPSGNESEIAIGTALGEICRSSTAVNELRHLEIVYCPIALTMKGIVNQVKPLTALETLDLVVHDHYDTDEGFDSDQEEADRYAVECNMDDLNNLDHQHYKITAFDLNRNPIVSIG
jgi:hypothetical protein